MNIEIKNYDLEELEKVVILKCLENNPNFSNNELANSLGISERNLYRKLEKYNIPSRRKKEKKHKFVIAFAPNDDKGWKMNKR